MMDGHWAMDRGCWSLELAMAAPLVRGRLDLTCRCAPEHS
jgi:hypothetical protein